MSDFTSDSVPRLAPGCRLSARGGSEPQERMLLIPEGALRLGGPAYAILQLCDGERTVAGIVEELSRRYSSTDAARIETEVAEFLARLRDRRVIEWTPRTSPIH